MLISVNQFINLQPKVYIYYKYFKKEFKTKTKLSNSINFSSCNLCSYNLESSQQFRSVDLNFNRINSFCNQLTGDKYEKSLFDKKSFGVQTVEEKPNKIVNKTLFY